MVMNTATYDEIYEEDVKQVKAWVNEHTPFAFVNNHDTWEYHGFWLSDAILEYVNPVLNPRILWEVAKKEIEKLYENLYQTDFNKFHTNICTINATYCFVGERATIFYDDKKSQIASFDTNAITSIKIFNGDSNDYECVYQKGD